MTVIGRLLAHPLTRGLHPDDPRTTFVRRDLIRSKPFLQKIYREWYRRIIEVLPQGEGGVLELGSGAGFFAELCPQAITSEMFLCAGIRLVADARRLPFADGSLRALVMTDVMHHIPQPQAFLAEARRILRPGGRIVMIEPWVSAWSRFVYARFHSEPFRPEASSWSFPSTGPLSGANGAVPWIVFERDAALFRELFPELVVEKIEPCMPFRYLFSGGVSLRSLAPGWSFPVLTFLERLTQPWMRSLAMFAFIQLERR